LLFFLSRADQPFFLLFIFFFLSADLGVAARAERWWWREQRRRGLLWLEGTGCSSRIDGGSYGDVGHEEMRDLWRCLLGTGSEDAGAGQVSNGSRGLLWDGRLGCSRLGGGMGSGCVQRGDEGQQRRGALLPALD
jgi:hypothetical protein